MSTPLPSEKLERGLSEAVALNMNAMVGIGPFIVIPLVIQAMGGPKRSAGAKVHGENRHRRRRQDNSDLQHALSALRQDFASFCHSRTK